MDTREEIRDEIRILADELTEAPLGLMTDVELNRMINRGQRKLMMALIDTIPWYFRKEVDISLVSAQREYNLNSDLGINGNVLITTANQKLDFDEGGGALVATIVATTYTPTALCAQMKTQLEAAGALTYTITYSGKIFRISSSAGTLNLNAATGPNIANGIWSTIGFAATDLSGFINYAGDKAVDFQNFLMFESILQQNAGSKPVPLVYLNPTDNFLHETVGQTAAPSAVKYWGWKDDNEIYVVPTPNASAANQLLGYYFRKTADLTQDSDSPALPWAAQDLLVYWVLKQWFLRDGDKGSQTVSTMYTEELQSVGMSMSNPQGPTPGKRPSVRTIQQA
ncbi:hypothetical protein LCGC14_0461100 [marine sediment metagenome]|uniref:Uncharacterized protein n=1 Tax=marine sediment metagenome TaxID=412755 RepID=A0A0F9VNZ2_9ZZZZ|nr:hypothetical protein [bacterium]